MSNFDFDYEFEICNCSFPQGDPECTSGHCDPFADTYALCTLPDPSGTRYTKIVAKIENFLGLVSQLSHLKQFSSFIEIDGTKYKLTIINDDFTNFV